MSRSVSFLLLVAILSSSIQADDEKNRSGQGLGGKSIEDLMNIEVTIASKRPQALTSVAAPIFVITQEDIRSSGATSIPELLRMVPGVEVAQLDSNKWAVSIRGFNSRFANKLLVLVDGRSVYTPLFSGVFWDGQDALLEDIDRIEVIRGPGGALWGANAVNGIINIITKPAQETVDALATAQTGDQDRLIGSVRGGESSGGKAYRFFGKYAERAGLFNLSGSRGADGWQMTHGGFRMDGTSGHDAYMIEGDAYGSRLGQTSAFPSLSPPFFTVRDDRFPVSGWNVLGRWMRESGSGVKSSLQASVDTSDRDMPEVGEKRSTLDLDFQQERNVDPRTALVWGAGYRTSADETFSSEFGSFTPGRRTTDLYSLFAQSDHAIRADMKLTLGLKLERNSYTGWEYQPSARILWSKSKNETGWASIGRAVRTPNRSEADIQLDFRSGFDAGSGLPFVIRLMGSDEFKSESVLAYEAGYRIHPSDNLFVDIAGFYNDYKNLRSFEQGTPFFDPFPVPHLVIPVVFGNKLRGSTHGLEVAANWKVSDRSTWGLAYSYLNEDLSFAPGSTDTLGKLFQSPRHQAQVRGSQDFKYGLGLGGSIKFVDAVPDDSAPAYWRLDLRLSWSPDKTRELSIGANNLFGSRHVESTSGLFEVAHAVGPSYYLGTRWRF